MSSDPHCPLQSWNQWETHRSSLSKQMPHKGFLCIYCEGVRHPGKFIQGWSECSKAQSWQTCAPKHQPWIISVKLIKILTNKLKALAAQPFGNSDVPIDGTPCCDANEDLWIMLFVCHCPHEEVTWCGRNVCWLEALSYSIIRRLCCGLSAVNRKSQVNGIYEDLCHSVCDAEITKWNDIVTYCT
jgi:hypothetical protein